MYIVHLQLVLGCHELKGNIPKSREMRIQIYFVITTNDVILAWIWNAKVAFALLKTYKP